MREYENLLMAARIADRVLKWSVLIGLLLLVLTAGHRIYRTYTEPAGCDHEQLTFVISQAADCASDEKVTNVRGSVHVCMAKAVRTFCQ